MKQIIDLLKDFIGITDIQECFTKGSISACLWAALDVGAIFFAALKIGKFAKAVKGALKLWKDFSKGRKLLERAKAAAKAAKDRLKKLAKECGVPVPLPAALEWSRRPGGVVHAGYAVAATGGGTRVTFAALPAKPKKKQCETKEEKPRPRNTRTLAEKKQLLGKLGYKRTKLTTRNGQPVYEAPKGTRPRYTSPDRDVHSGGDFKGADTPDALNSKETRSGTYRYVEDEEGDGGEVVRIGD